MHPIETHATGPAASLIVLRDLGCAERASANELVATAIQTWDLPDRVKRLVRSSYQYDEQDFRHLRVLGAWNGDRLVGFVSVEPAEPAEAPSGQAAMLLHGLYVLPELHGAGIGRRLVAAAKEIARAAGCTGLLVRAERSATGFFLKQGFAPLAVEDPRRDYRHRLWAAVAT